MANDYSTEFQTPINTGELWPNSVQNGDVVSSNGPGSWTVTHFDSSGVYSSALTTDDTVDPNGSPNNRMGDRSNTARFNGRIPDIFGTVRAVPDLLAQTYVIYKNNTPIEISYLCIGRGEYEITDLRDGPTSFYEIPNLKYDIYGPNTSPRTDTGNVGEPFSCVIRSRVVDNQEIPAPNYSPVDYDDPDPAPFAGPVIFDSVKSVIINFSMPSGAIAVGVTVRLDYQAVDNNDTPFGIIHTESFTIPGNTSSIGYTHTSGMPFLGRAQVSISRISNFNIALETNKDHKRLIVEDVYGVLDIDELHFGDITTLRVSLEPYANSGSRKLSCLATRKLEGVATSKFADIAKAVCLDPFIGNRQLTEIDMAGLTALQAEIEAYFGTTLAAEFNYTFDDNNTSFEETLTSVCAAAFVTPYRQGTLIKFSFERLNEISRLLFNHRNKLPDSEVRSINFGYLGEKDGVEYEYTDTKDGAKINFYLPSDQSAINAEAAAPVGITNKLQIYFHAHRQFAKQRYQNTTVEFNATHEAQLLVLNDRILVSDNTRSDTYDGEIVAQNGLILTLSQPFEFPVNGSVTIFVQGIDGIVEGIGISPVSGEKYQVLLDHDTQFPLAVRSDRFTRATYEIAVEGAVRREAFLVQEKSPSQQMVVNIKAVNYDARYYTHDKDLINAIVDANGNLL
jgi:hypothetical protein